MEVELLKIREKANSKIFKLKVLIVKICIRVGITKLHLISQLSNKIIALKINNSKEIANIILKIQMKWVTYNKVLMIRIEVVIK